MTGERLLEAIGYIDPALVEDARAYIAASERCLPESAALEHYGVGDRVAHDVLGPGTVVEVDADKAAHIIQFDSMSTPRAISFRAKLNSIEK